MIPRGLSLDQAPPLSVPLRFFLTAPLFGMAAGVILALGHPGALHSRWSSPALALTHLFVLGVIVMVMLGALQQMLPVVAGATISRARLVSGVVHAAWTLGVPCLALGFGTGSPEWTLSGMAFLLVGGLTFVAVAGSALLRSTSRVESVTAMRLALLAFAITIALGATLAAARSGVSLRFLALARPLGFVSIHAAFGLIGWIALLVIGVSWQVVPMLQVTPPYPELLRRWTAPVLFALLLARAAAFIMIWESVLLPVDALIGIVLALFALATLNIQRQRRRHVPDAALDLFRAAMVFLLVAVVVELGGRVAGLGREACTLIAALAGIVGFASTLVVAMLLKIVAFLGWFHLQALAGQRVAQGLPPIAVPTMKELVPDVLARWQVRAHVAACVVLVAAPLRPSLLQVPAGLALAASFALLLVILLRAALRFRAALQPSRPAPSPAP